METKASVSHDEVIVKMLRASREFEVEYLKAALADEEEPRVLPIALRHIAEARGGLAKAPRPPGSSARVCTEPCRRAAIRVSRHCSPSSKLLG
jgi:hypothetical protein